MRIIEPPVPYRSAHLRAAGNLTYLEFIRVVEALWSEGHPGVPLFASGGGQYAQYPAIVYSLGMRKTHPNEPKVRYREEIRTDPGEDAILIAGQRFQNVVNFSAIDEHDPRVAEELVEAFEDFMLEFTPVLKELGLSEIVYARRLPDDDQPRVGEGIVIRTVSYLVTTEKVIQTTETKLKEFLIHARAALLEVPSFTASSDTDTFTVHGASFYEGDAITLYQRTGEEFPAGTDGMGNELRPGVVYYVHSVVPTTVGNEYRLATAYDSSENPISIEISGSGSITAAPEDLPRGPVTSTIEDTYSSATPSG